MTNVYCWEVDISLQNQIDPMLEHYFRGIFFQNAIAFKVRSILYHTVLIECVLWYNICLNFDFVELIH